MTPNMVADQYNVDPYQVQKIMATIIQCRSMRIRLKLGHRYQIYNVDICHTYANLSTSMTIKMWIHSRNHTNIPSQPREINEHLTDTQGICLVFHKV